MSGETTDGEFGPGSAWQVALERARDLRDEGELRRLWGERADREAALEEERWATEQAAADDALPEVQRLDARIAELAASDDEDELAEAKRLGVERPQLVATARVRALNEAEDEATFALMDAEGRGHGFFDPAAGKHVDTDPVVAQLRRELTALEVEHDGDPKAARAAHEIRASIDARVEELMADPARTTLPLNSQLVPGSEAPPTEPLQQQIMDAEARALETGDWSEFDQLQAQALAAS